jgi:hypothetical protein
VPLSNWDRKRAEAAARRVLESAERPDNVIDAGWRRRPVQPIDGEVIRYAEVAPQRPPFDYQAFERKCQLAREEIELLMDQDSLPDAGTAYASRLDVLKGYFKSHAAGLLREEDVFKSVVALAEELQDTPHGGLLALEYAKVGFLELYRPDLAKPFGAEVDRRLSRLRAAEHQALPQLPEGRHAATV